MRLPERREVVVIESRHVFWVVNFNGDWGTGLCRASEHWLKHQNITLKQWLLVIP